MKNARKNASLAFYHAFYVQNLVKIKKNPLFSLKREYLRITKKYRSQCRKVLETWNLAKLGSKVIQKEILGRFFDFQVFRPDSQVFRPKNQIFPNFLFEKGRFYEKISSICICKYFELNP